eukprot:461434-Pelagomonas_calceolata.AAC.20
MEMRWSAAAVNARKKYKRVQDSKDWSGMKTRVSWKQDGQHEVPQVFYTLVYRASPEEPDVELENWVEPGRPQDEDEKVRLWGCPPYTRGMQPSHMGRADSIQ